MKFCTNCGKSLVAEPSMPTMPGSGGGDFTPRNIAPTTPRKSGGAGKNLAIFGGLGCLALVLIATALAGTVIYLASGEDNKNVGLANTSGENSKDNSASQNRNTSGNKNTKPPFETKSSTNTDSTADPSSTPFITDEQFLNFLPAELGGFEQDGGTQNGNLTEDFPGSDRIVKSDYIKGNKKVRVILAQFSSPATAKSSYGYFLDGFKGAGAKILGRQKVRNKSKVETGEIAFYTYSKVYETMFYTDRFGFRITAPDRGTLLAYLKAFEAYTKTISTEQQFDDSSKN
jgi:hypothetical protein